MASAVVLLLLHEVQDEFVMRRARMIAQGRIVTFERTVFDHQQAASRPPEHAIVFRAQFNLQPSL